MPSAAWAAMSVASAHESLRASDLVARLDSIDTSPSSFARVCPARAPTSLTPATAPRPCPTMRLSRPSRGSRLRRLHHLHDGALHEREVLRLVPAREQDDVDRLHDLAHSDSHPIVPAHRRSPPGATPAR